MPNTSLLENLVSAHAAPRCSHIKVDGTRCGSPAMNGEPFCYFHDHHFYSAQHELQFQPFEDGNAIQLAIMQVVSELRYNRIDARVAKTLLYGLQTASINLCRVKLDPPSDALQATPAYSHLLPPPKSLVVKKKNARAQAPRLHKTKVPA